MLENIVFSLDRVLPYFLLMVVGMLLSGAGLVSRSFLSEANRFTFKIALPAQIFCGIVNMEKPGGGEALFMLYILLVTCCSFAVIWLVTELIYKEKAIIGTLVQSSFRSNYILLGVPLAGSVLGPAAFQIATIASIVIIPAYNILSVIVLASRSKSEKWPSVADVMRDIITNPLIIAICIALPFTFLSLRLPMMLDTTLNYVGQTGTPLGLLSIGGLLNKKDAAARLRPAIYATVIKNILLPAAVIAVSIAVGYRGKELITIFVMAAAPVAMSSYAMTTQMGGDGPLASNIVILSTLLSGFTLAVGIYILRTFALI